jgi:hypothetical protein
MLFYVKLPKDIVLIILTYLNHGWNYDKNHRCDMIRKCHRLREIKSTLSTIILHAPYNSIHDNNNYHNTFRAYINEIVLELKNYISGYIGNHKLVTRCLNLITYYMKRARISIPMTHVLDHEIINTQKLLHSLFVSKGYQKRLFDL